MSRKMSLKGLAAWRRASVVLVLVLVLLLPAVSVISQPSSGRAGAGNSLERWQISPGGGEVSGSSYLLSSAIAVPNAGFLVNEKYQLLGGFWLADSYTIHLPLVVR